MYRRTQHPWLRLYHLGANALHTWASIRHLPPDQLLRRVFESCGTYAEAKDMLENTPVARPVIYLLIGCARGERCVIERSENGFETRVDETSAANDWAPGRPMWGSAYCGYKLESPGERGGKAIGEPQEHLRAGEERMGVWRYAWGKILMPDLGTAEDSRGNCKGTTNYDGEGIIA